MGQRGAGWGGKLEVMGVGEAMVSVYWVNEESVFIEKYEEKFLLPLRLCIM